MKRALVLVIAACSRRDPITTCDDDLRGVYAAGADERWMVLDHGATLEAYPLFPDPGSAEDARLATEVGPRVIDLARSASGLTGTLRRRYLRRELRCDAQVPVRVTRCAADALELVLADPSPPTELSPCTWPRPGDSRVVRWRRD